MDNSTFNRTAWLRLSRTAAAWAALGLLISPAVAQQTPPPIEDRYGLASEEYTADAPPAATPLLSYDRSKDEKDEASTGAVAGPSNEPSQAASLPVHSSNPLRPAMELKPLATVKVPEKEPAPAPWVADARPLYSATPAAPPSVATPNVNSQLKPESAPRYDLSLEPVAREVTLPNVDVAKPQAIGGSDTADAISRRLAPLSTDSDKLAGATASRRESGLLPGAVSKLQSMSTAGMGLAVVVGLFVVCMMLMRRGGGKSSGALPAEAFTVLGRAPLAAQSFAQLIRVGNKLVLVAMTPGGPQPLTEVTDPMEVGRLIGLCASGASHGPAAEFQQVLAQLAREPARGFLGGEAPQAGGRRSS